MTEVTEMQKHVEGLIKKAAEVADSADAMRFSQAAVNAANAMCSLESAKTIGQPTRYYP